MKLYQLTQNYMNLQELLENPEIPKEMVIEALNNVGDELEDKAENIAKLIKTLDVEVAGFKEEEKRLAERRRALENNAKRLKTYLEDTIRTTGKVKFKGKLFRFNIQKNPSKLNIESMDNIPKNFFIEQEPVLDNKALLTAMKEGLKIEGVSIVQTESLRIR